jgi:hypothetical protein
VFDELKYAFLTPRVSKRQPGKSRKSERKENINKNRLLSVCQCNKYQKDDAKHDFLQLTNHQNIVLYSQLVFHYQKYDMVIAFFELHNYYSNLQF